MTHLNFESMGIQSEKHKLKSKFDLYNFHSQKIDWELISKELADINWSEALDITLNPDQQYNNFLEICLQVLDKNLPLRKLPKKHSRIPRDRRILMRKRKKLTKKNSKSNKIKQKIIDIEILLQKSHKHERNKLELDATSKIKANPKYFFSYAKRFSNKQTNI